MLTFPPATQSSSSHQNDVCNDVIFLPLDESTGYQRLDEYLEQEVQRFALAQAAEIDNDELLDALIEAGFTSKNIAALHLAPIALVAWASDAVTDRESQAAVWSIHEHQLFHLPGAASQVQWWLDVRPGLELLDLWEDYTQYRLQRTPDVVRKIVGKRLLHQATSVALASGGFMGMGKICAAEQSILHSIGDVYGI